MLKKFTDCDIVEVLREVMKHNTVHYQTDFDYDVEQFTKAAYSPKQSESTFLWLSRPNGTQCNTERGVFVKETQAHNTWIFHAEQTNDPIVAYAVEIKDERNGCVVGDLYELDFKEYYKYVKENSLPAYQVQLIYRETVKCIPYEKQFGTRLELNDLNRILILPENLKQWDETVLSAKEQRHSKEYEEWDLARLKSHFEQRKCKIQFINQDDRKPMFAVYQLKERCFHELAFLSLEALLKSGNNVARDNYSLVYADSYNNEDLEAIYERFNIDRPKDFYGHSLSVSDILVIKENGNYSAYYVDDFGFEEIDGFISDTAPQKSGIEM